MKALMSDYTDFTDRHETNPTHQRSSSEKHTVTCGSEVLQAFMETVLLFKKKK